MAGYEYIDETNTFDLKEYLQVFLKPLKSDFPEAGHSGKGLSIELGHMRRGSKNIHRANITFQNKQPLNPLKPIFRIYVKINRENKYPLKLKVATGTQSLHATADRRTFRYLFSEIVFENIREHAVFLLGHELWHFLKMSKQATGRNSEPAANRYGIYFLDTWRSADF